MTMGKKHYQLKAAHAQASRWKAHTSSTTVFGEAAPCKIVTDENSSLPLIEMCQLILPQQILMNSPMALTDTCELLDSDGSDAASLCELDGDELEENLAALGQSVEMMNKPNPSGWNETFQVKTTKEWEKLEKNRSLGYSGHSDQTR
ncbi:hypothetical protein EDC04DRAFT_2600198 [Pisolithus marmoratus]|nr:hypothetical protein EDC04DRAFT_2600198 [Pisolithus marmoratus]